MRRKLLILAANPKSTSTLRLDEEIRRINDSLQRSKNRKQFIIHITTATTPRHLRRAILDHKPEIVHFCGHGAGIEGIAFEDDSGNLKLVSNDALTLLFQLSRHHVKCVVLNACFAEVQASEIVNYIEYVIGMKHAIGDTAALKFAEGFYDALFAGEHYATCFEFGKNSIQLEDLSEELIPILKKNISINFNQNFLDVKSAKGKQSNISDHKNTKIQSNQSNLKLSTLVSDEVKPIKNGSKSKFFSKKPLFCLWLISLFLIIGISYYAFTPKRSPLLGYYTEISKSEPTSPVKDFVVMPGESILVNYQDPIDGNLWQIAVSTNMLFYVGEGRNVYIGQYDAIWKFKQIKSEKTNSDKIRMEGVLVSRPGFSNLRETNLKVFNITDPNNNFMEFFKKVEKGYNHGVIEIQPLDDDYITIRRSAIFNGNISEPRTFDYIKGVQGIER